MWEQYTQNIVESLVLMRFVDIIMSKKKLSIYGGLTNKSRSLKGVYMAKHWQKVNILTN